ncbi:MAG: ECF transporter S component [Mycoplasmoidaceae bacterium]
MKKELLNNKFLESKNKNTFKIFLFPFYPINFFRSTILMALLSSLVALRVIMQFFTIPIPQFGLTLSISHTPIIVIGWLFGPVIGFFTGILTDTICYFAKPTSPWFYLYAIQEPLLCMMSGILGSLYLINKNKEKMKTEIVVSKLVLYLFSLFTLIILIIYAQPNNNFQGSSDLDDNDFFNVYKYVAIGVIILFVIVYEIFFLYLYKKKKKVDRLFLYLTTIGFLNAIIFSFFLGTISAVEYTRIFFPSNNNFIKYGAMFYVTPRVIKESIKTPIQIILLFSIIMSVTPYFEKMINNILLSWNSGVEKKTK